MQDGPMHGWTRFSILGLLFLIFCAAGASVGFRFAATEATDAQLEAQVEQQIAALRAQVYPISYGVADLASSDSAVRNLETLSSAALAREIQSTLNRKRWQAHGGPCTLRAINPTTIVVAGAKQDHEIVDAYLAGRRDSSRGGSNQRRK